MTSPTERVFNYGKFRLEHFEALIALEEEGSFPAAAARLGNGSKANTCRNWIKQITDSIEDWKGQLVVPPTGNSPAIVTPEGKEFVRRLKSALGQIYDLLDDPCRQRITLAGSSAILGLVPRDVVEEQFAKHELEVNMRPCVSREANELLIRGTANVALVIERPNIDEGFEFFDIGAWDHALFVPNSWDVANPDPFGRRILVVEGELADNLFHFIRNRGIEPSLMRLNTQYEVVGFAKSNPEEFAAFIPLNFSKEFPDHRYFDFNYEKFSFFRRSGWVVTRDGDDTEKIKDAAQKLADACLAQKRMQYRDFRSRGK